MHLSDQVTAASYQYTITLLHSAVNKLINGVYIPPAADCDSKNSKRCKQFTLIKVRELFSLYSFTLALCPSSFHPCPTVTFFFSLNKKQPLAHTAFCYYCCICRSCILSGTTNSSHLWTLQGFSISLTKSVHSKWTAYHRHIVNICNIFVNLIWKAETL